MNEFGLKLKSLRKSRGINQKELADYLGVAQNTVANYENGKRQPNTQTLKKIVTYFGSVAAYLLEEDEGQVLSSRTLDYERLQKEFASRLTKDQSEEAKELLFSLLPLESEELVGIYENIFVPTLYHIGILWEQGQISVAKEHLYSNLITNMMQHLSNQYFYGKQQGTAEEEAKKAAVCVNIYGDLHTIGLRMIHDYFRILGIKSYYLGANVPTDSLIEFLISHKVKYLAISVTLDQYVDSLLNLIQILRKQPELQGLKIYVGGQGVIHRRENLLGVDAIIKNFKQVSGVIH